MPNTPSTIYPGFGIDRWDNADQVGRGIATLGVITGQIGKKAHLHSEQWGKAPYNIPYRMR